MLQSEHLGDNISYVLELTSPQLSIELAINIFGVMTAYWVDYGMSFVSSEAQFRLPLALQCLFAVLTIMLIAFLPESPRWVSSIVEL